MAVGRAIQLTNRDVLVEQRWLRNDTSDNSEDTITSRFERQVATVPDNLALVTDEISLTYRKLDRKASRIAAELASLPCHRDQPIALFMKDEAARIAAMLGAWKASRIFIPVAPDSPEKWLTQVLEDSGTGQIIVDSSTRSIAKLAATGSVTVVEVERLARSLELFAGDRTASSNDTAYVVYTSGSTGRPKGVANTHRSLLRRSDVRYPLFGLGRGDRHANLRSTGVSVGINITLLPLLSGGCLFPFDLHRHGLHKLAAWLVAQEITYVSFSGSLLRTWLTSLPDDVRFPALRFVEANSEPLYAQNVIRMAQHLEGDWRIGHSYASTESGVIAAQVFTSSCLPDPGIVAVGRPVDGVEVCIKDDTGALVPPGDIGEIAVRSRFLAQGYWNNPDLTAKVFQTDPLDSAIRICRTGDLGRWRSDGTLELMGRKGRRVRLRGYSVEPFQVECELMRQPSVRDAVVVLHDGAAGEEPCLVGYVVAPPNASPSAMRQAIAERLPSYMVPSHIVVLDSFPIASSGKVDRNALPPPYREEARPAAFRAPSDDCERELLAIWQEVLKIPNIGIDDDFFDLGGDSLQALTVLLEIEAQLGRSLSPTTLLQAPTIARLAEFIRASKGIEAFQSLVPLRASGSGVPLFLVSTYLVGMHYRHLVSDLKSDRPVFGLQSPPLDGKHRIPRTIESMAADYVTEIRRVRPHGPYFLAGHSFGGLVSFEIAQQLVREGECVSFLGLIDTVIHDISVKRRRWVRERMHLLVRGLRFIMKAAFTRQLDLESVRQFDLWIRLGVSIPYKYRPTYHSRLSRRASHVYVHKLYPGHITFFSSAGNSDRQRAHWGRLAGGGLTVLEVSACHGDLVLPPHSKLLAEYFDACLDDAVAESPVKSSNATSIHPMTGCSLEHVHSNPSSSSTAASAVNQN
jgi:amino acid adenylation domain-containing protein